MSRDGGALRGILTGPRRGLGLLVALKWRLLLALASGSRRGASPAAEVTGAGPVAVVAPHPDDETAGCGGVILQHLAAGDRVTVIVVTDGRRSTALGQRPEEMAMTRRREVEAAAAILGVDDLHWLGLPEGGWSLEGGTKALERSLGDLAPALIYAPSRVDFHPEHRAVARALARLVGGWRATLRVYPVQVPLTPTLADLAVDVTAERTALVAALRAHRSQWGNLRSTLRRRHYAAAQHGLPGLVEELWSLPAPRYAALHGDELEGVESYRGLRFDPWTDPLAFWVGRRHRRRLRGGG